MPTPRRVRRPGGRSLHGAPEPADEKRSQTLVGSVLPVAGALAPVCAAMIAAERVGFAAAFGAPPDLFIPGIPELLLSAILGVCLAAWLVALALMIIRAAVPSKNSKALGFGSLLLALSAMTTLYLTRGSPAFRGDPRWVVSITAQCAFIAIAIVYVAHFIRSMALEITDQRFQRFTLGLVILYFIASAWIPRTQDPAAAATAVAACVYLSALLLYAVGTIRKAVAAPKQSRMFIALTPFGTYSVVAGAISLTLAGFWTHVEAPPASEIGNLPSR